MFDLRLVAVTCMAVAWLSEVDALCKIQFRIFSDTSKKFKIEFSYMALKQKTDKMYFGIKGFQRNITLEGPSCLGANEPLVVRTYTALSGSRADEQHDVKAKEMRAYFQGIGYVNVHIEDNLVPSFRAREGVFCMGECW